MLSAFGEYWAVLAGLYGLLIVGAVVIVWVTECWVGGVLAGCLSRGCLCEYGVCVGHWRHSSLFPGGVLVFLPLIMERVRARFQHVRTNAGARC